MKRTFLICLLLSGLLWSVDFEGQQLLNDEALAQSFDMEGVVTNPAFFINVTESFQTASFEIQRAEIEGSPFFLGQTALHIDTTAQYEISAGTQFDGSRTLLPQEEVRSSQQPDEPQVGRCEVAIDSTAFQDGGSAPISEIYESTAGTPGRDHLIQLRVDATELELVALGTYACEIRVDVISDDFSVFFATDLIEFSVIDPKRN